MLQVEKNIPAPEGRGGRPKKYPFDTMEVGDSFFVPFDGSDEVKFKTKIRVAASKASTRLGGTFTTRGVDGGVRCWMIPNSSQSTADEI